MSGELAGLLPGLPLWHQAQACQSSMPSSSPGGDAQVTVRIGIRMSTHHL